MSSVERAAMTYRLVDHTADVAIEAEGADLGEALAEAARAVAEVVTGRPSARGADRTVSFKIEAPDEEALVVAFLSEVLWVLEWEGALWCGGGVEVVPGGPGWVATARGNAVSYEPSTHGRGVEVKAVTYSDLRIDRGATTRLRVVLDL